MSKSETEKTVKPKLKGFSQPQLVGQWVDRITRQANKKVEQKNKVIFNNACNHR
jgi:hypothetical protein